MFDVFGDTITLNSLKFKPIDCEIAKIVLERCHYLKSYRFDSLHFGLFYANNEFPTSMVTFSLNDLYHLKDSVKYADNSMVLSRAFAFPNAPKNSLSFLFSRARKWLLKNYDVKEYLTYLNPNLDFTGSSYYSDNWKLLDIKEDTQYSYINGIYKTEREILNIYGKTLGELLNNNTDGIEVSKIKLLPKNIFYKSILV